MAIGYHGTGTAFEPTTTYTNLVLPVPAGVPSGALMLAIFGGNSDSDLMGSPAAGWTPLLNENPPGGGMFQETARSGQTLRIFWRIASESEPSSYTWIWDSTSRGGGFIVAFTGVDNTTPFDVAYTVSLNTTADNTIEYPAITPITSGAYVVRVGNQWKGTSDTASFAAPSGHTLMNTWDNRRGGLGAYKAWAGGTEAATSSTATGTTGASVGVSIALRPASGAGPINVSLQTGQLTAQGQAVGPPAQPGTAANILSRRQGAATSTGFEATGKFTTDVTSLALRVSPNSDMSSPLSDFSGSLTSALAADATAGFDAGKYGRATATGLSPNTVYHWRWVVNGGMVSTEGGQIRTLPTEGTATSFDFAAASCSDHTPTARSNSAIFDSIADAGVRYLFHMGDMYYDDPNTADADEYRSRFDRAIEDNARQQRVFSEVPVGYIYGDHDFSGNNSSGSTGGTNSLGADTAPDVVREVFPMSSDALNRGNDTAIDYTVQIGRVHFFHMDTRTESNDRNTAPESSRTKLGAAQKQRLKDWLNDSSRKYRPKVVFTQEPWHDLAENSGGETTGDGWGRYYAERTEIINYISTNGITNVVFVGGDAHMLAYATSGTPGGFPVYQAAPFGNSISFKGGPWAAQFPTTEQSGDFTQYGHFAITDSGGSSITLQFTGRNASGTQLTAPLHTFTQVDGPGVNVNLATGSVSATGQALGRTGARDVPLVTGQSTATGQPLGRTGARSVPLVTGQVTATGQTLGVTKVRDVPLATGSSAVQGQAVGVSIGGAPSVTVSLATGSVSAAGQTLGRTGARDVPITTGQMSAAGQTLGRTGARDVPLVTGSAVATGQALGRTGAYTVTLVTGSVTAQGQNVGVAVQGGAVNVALVTGSLSAAGQTLGFAPGAKSVALSTGSIAATGQTLAVDKVRQVALATAQAAAVGQPLGASVAINVALATGTLTAQGQPLANLNRTIALKTGILTAVGPKLTVIEYPVPPDRRAVVEPDVRRIVVDPERRRIVVESEARRLEVHPEKRRVVVNREIRRLKV